MKYSICFFFYKRLTFKPIDDREVIFGVHFSVSSLLLRLFMDYQVLLLSDGQGIQATYNGYNKYICQNRDVTTAFVDKLKLLLYVAILRFYRLGHISCNLTMSVIPATISSPCEPYSSSKLTQ